MGTRARASFTFLFAICPLSERTRPKGVTENGNQRYGKKKSNWNRFLAKNFICIFAIQGPQWQREAKVRKIYEEMTLTCARNDRNGYLLSRHSWLALAMKAYSYSRSRPNIHREIGKRVATDRFRAADLSRYYLSENDRKLSIHLLERHHWVRETISLAVVVTFRYCIRLLHYSQIQCVTKIVKRIATMDDIICTCTRYANRISNKAFWIYWLANTQKTLLSRYKRVVRVSFGNDEHEVNQLQNQWKPRVLNNYVSKFASLYIDTYAEYLRVSRQCSYSV